MTRGLLPWFGVVALTAVLGAAASIEAGSFYAQLARPAWSPPGWLFGPVWTLLYLTIALAGWQHWRTHGWAGQLRAHGLFGVQLVLNALWSWLFFAWRLGAWALLDILLLLAAIGAIIVLYLRSGSRLAGLMLLPYLLWVAFASALNWSVWRANPALL